MVELLEISGKKGNDDHTRKIASLIGFYSSHIQQN